MANAYTCIHIQFVFCVKYRRAMITTDYDQQLYKYLTGTLQAHGHKMIIINGVEDHIHLLAGILPSESISDICEYLKTSSSNWINDHKLTKSKFQWQRGYGAFSYSLSDLPNVIHYIDIQKLKHQTISFKTEYESTLKEHEIDFDDRYVFDYLDP